MHDMYYSRGVDATDTMPTDVTVSISGTTCRVLMVDRVMGGVSSTSSVWWAGGSRRSAFVDSWHKDVFMQFLSPAKNWRWYHVFNIKQPVLLPAIKPVAIKIVKMNKCVSVSQHRAHKRKQFMKRLK